MKPEEKATPKRSGSIIWNFRALIPPFIVLNDLVFSGLEISKRKSSPFVVPAAR
jgi:hypothetical protein